MMNYNGLDVKAQLNIDANSIATITTTIPINTHVISVPFSMYINNKYIHYRFDHSIHIDSHKHEAQLFLQNKYTWSTKIFHSINWNSHAFYLLSQRLPYPILHENFKIDISCLLFQLYLPIDRKNNMFSLT